MAFDLKPWMPFGELTTFREEMDDDPYQRREEADTGDQENIPECDINIAGIYFRRGEQGSFTHKGAGG